LRDANVEAVAICFLYSFLDSTHEKTARRIVSEEFPEAFVCASYEVAPEFREYERLSTTVVNAYLGPIMAHYIRGVADRLYALGVAATPYLTQSNGGVIGFDAAARAAGAGSALGAEHRRDRRPGDSASCRSA
jgi:N-methylhydantoinase A